MHFIAVINVFRGFSICYYPVIVTMVYQLPGIRPREVAVGLAFIYTVMNAGAAVGPIAVGAMVETGLDLRTALFVTTLFPTSLLAAAILLRSSVSRMSTDEPEAERAGMV